MRGLLSHYPFATTLRTHPSGQGFMYDPYARLELNGFAAIEQWVRDAQFLRNQVRYLFVEYVGTLRPLLQAATPDETVVLDNSIFQATPRLEPLATLTDLVAAIPSEPDLSLQAVVELGDIADETGALLRRRQAYLAKTPSRRPFVALIVLGFIALICGAILPMLFSGLPTLVTVWVPSVIYVIAGLAGLRGTINALRA